jgi:hypothetical protein
MDIPLRAVSDGDGSVADFFLAYNKRGGERKHCNASGHFQQTEKTLRHTFRKT